MAQNLKSVSLEKWHLHLDDLRLAFMRTFAHSSRSKWSVNKTELINSSCHQDSGTGKWNYWVLDLCMHMPGACLSFHLYVCQHIWTHCAQCLCVCAHVEVVMRHEIRHGWSWADMNGGLVLSHRGYTVGCSNTNLSVPLLCVPRGGSVMIFMCMRGVLLQNINTEAHPPSSPSCCGSFPSLSIDRWRWSVTTEEERRLGEGNNGFHTGYGYPGDFLAPVEIITQHHH